MTEIERKRAEPKWWFIAYSFGLGLLLGAAAWVGGEPGMALFAVPLLTLVGAVAAFTPFGRLRASSRDERENAIDRDAMVYSGYAMMAVTLTWWLWSIAQGEPSNELTAVAAAGGLAYLVALVILPRRR